MADLVEQKHVRGLKQAASEAPISGADLVRLFEDHWV